MKITVTSTFHNGMTQTFAGLKEGRNYRRYRSCGDCTCGWPVYRAEWSEIDGYTVNAEFTQNKGEIAINITKEAREKGEQP